MGFDVCDADAVAASMHSAEERFGAVDFLVNCAGIASISPTLDILPACLAARSRGECRWHLLRLESLYQQALAAKRPGAIVNLASVAGLLALPDRPAYISSKHAVVGLTREMAMEFGAANIRVNAVAPGVIRTAMSEKHFQDPERPIASPVPMHLAGAGDPRKLLRPSPFSARMTQASSQAPSLQSTAATVRARHGESARATGRASGGIARNRDCRDGSGTLPAGCFLAILGPIRGSLNPRRIAGQTSGATSALADLNKIETFCSSGSARRGRAVGHRSGESGGSPGLSMVAQPAGGRTVRWRDGGARHQLHRVDRGARHDRPRSEARRFRR